MSEQLELGVDEAPYFLDYRDYCGVWELRARERPFPDMGWELKQFDSQRKAADALRWMLADYERTGVLRKQYPKGAPHWDTRPCR